MLGRDREGGALLLHTPPSARLRAHSRPMWKRVLQGWDLYLIILPALAVLIVFRYLPIYGIQIAFKDYNLIKGIAGSDWVGLKHFRALLSSQDFLRVFRNTLLINVYRLVWQFPIPILMALLISESTLGRFKKGIQTLTYLPHFLSWVVIAAIFMNLLSDVGVVNTVMKALHLPTRVWLSESRYFRTLLVVSDGWKNSGWGSIVYLSAIMAVESELYEAAVVDGASRVGRIWHVTLPSIRPTIVFILMMRLSAALSTDMEQVLMLYNPMVYDVGDVLATYTYRVGLGQMKYSYSAAVGLFTSVVGFILLMSGDAVSRRLGERSLF